MCGTTQGQERLDRRQSSGRGQVLRAKKGEESVTALRGLFTFLRSYLAERRSKGVAYDLFARI